MSSVMIIEDGVHWQEHTFHVHRYNDDVPLSQRLHEDTLGRFESSGIAAVQLEERKYPENLHVETRTEWIEIQCDCEAGEPSNNLLHLENCAITKAYALYGTKEG
jgi:hypothetical protein